MTGLSMLPSGAGFVSDGLHAVIKHNRSKYRLKALACHPFVLFNESLHYDAKILIKIERETAGEHVLNKSANI